MSTYLNSLHKIARDAIAKAKQPGGVKDSKEEYEVVAECVYRAIVTTALY